MDSHTVPCPEAVTFGDFEFDLRSRQLRRCGRYLKLERIPAELLLLLVERAGDVVTRQAIVERIWGKGVYLDTDNSIYGAVRKVRHVLRDKPGQPRFIGTISGTGYRFIAPVSLTRSSTPGGP
jgi:DNA-binding winged helix-turn-helix (wHTH) protein